MIRQSGKMGSLKKKVYSDLKEKILFGDLLPGTVLNEEELCQTYQTSRTPVREALLQLEKEGYINIESRKSTRVSKISIQEMNDIIETRVLIESHILRTQTKPPSDDFVKKLREIYERFCSIDPAHPERLKIFLQLDFEFHLHLVSLSKNNQLVSTCYDLLERSIRQWYLMCVHSQGRMEESMNEHHAIIEVLCAGKFEEACKLLEQHIKRFYDITFFC